MPGTPSSVTLFLVLVYLRTWHCLHLRHPRVADTHFVQKVIINSVMNFWKPSMLLLWYFISKNHDVIILKTIEFLLTKFSIIVSKFWWRQCLCDPVSPRFCDQTIFIRFILSAHLGTSFSSSSNEIYFGAYALIMLSLRATGRDHVQKLLSCEHVLGFSSKERPSFYLTAIHNNSM